MPFAVYTLILSLFTGAFGMTKFFVKGPLFILPQNALLGGVLSAKFFILFLLNTMFVVRTFCLEATLFTFYRTSSSNIADINPTLPDEYRLIIYLIPGFISFLTNLIKLLFSMRLNGFRFFISFPQFLLCPMFCPLMFEGDPDQRSDNQPPIRVWKLGSILNSVFLGCLPQILLVAMDHHKQVPSWNFKLDAQDNNALFKYSYGNEIFSISTFLLYLFLTTIFFGWDQIFKNDGMCCRNTRTISLFCSNPCSKTQSPESNSLSLNDKEESLHNDDPSTRDFASDEKLQETENEKTEVRVLMMNGSWGTYSIL